MLKQRYNILLFFILSISILAITYNSNDLKRYSYEEYLKEQY